MDKLPVVKWTQDLVPMDALSPDKQPDLAYLAGLSKGSRRTMAGALDVIAQIVTGDESAGYMAIPWSKLRFQHTNAIRSEMARGYMF